MPFIPHTQNDIEQMLADIGAGSINALFDEIPDHLLAGELTRVPAGLTEMEITRLMKQRAAKNNPLVCFAGGGAYEHHIPAAVWEITTRGEFYSAYTPYQAEASQGTLQLIYEYQSMMSSLMGLDVSNASLYDGASALGEAVLMAVRANRKSKSKKILVPKTVNPTYRKVAKAVVENQGIELVEIDFDETTGTVDPKSLEQYNGEDIAALVIPQPNYFGCLEDADALTDWAANNKTLSIGLVNPTVMSVIAPPGEWGENGADVACGDGQPLGAPLSNGGPYFGFMCCKKAHVRQMPGRIIGKTVDLEGKPGYVLTLQAREQHIRRSKATSNICTNQGLLVTAATIYMSILGEEGLARVAAHSHNNTQALIEEVSKVDGVSVRFNGTSFHEVVIDLPKNADQVREAMAQQGYLAGVSLAECDMPNSLVLCATEVRVQEEIEGFANALNAVLKGEAA